jgi:hypothetical protein
MVVLPAVGLGLVFVFLLGALVTWGALELIARLRKTEPDSLKEDTQVTIALIGGGFAVVLMILSLFIVPRETVQAMWVVLTVLGILLGLATFLINDTAKAQPWTEVRPPKSAKAPPRAARDVHKPSAPTSVPQPVKADAYRDLLAKAQYDKARAERLIEDERKHLPSASFDELCKSATARLDRSASASG